MKLYSEDTNYKLYQGNMLDMLEVIESNSIDSIVTDPPYGLTSITKRFGKESSAPAQYGTDGSFNRLCKGFMGKEWDGSGIEYNVDAWKKCYEVLKPGGYLLAFGGTRTFHRIACAIEDAGFEIRDTIMWLYGSGFPKSMNIGLAIDKKNGVESEVGGIKPGHEDFVNRKTDGHMKFADGMDGFDRPWMHDSEKRESYHYQKVPTSNLAKQWDGWGTALKPSYEPIIVARKPLEGTCVDNVLKYGVGGINIDECRIGTEEVVTNGKGGLSNPEIYGNFSKSGISLNSIHQGRFPANTILTYDETDEQEVCGGFPDTKGNAHERFRTENNVYSGKTSGGIRQNDCWGDEGSASRYFYCAKASKKDRDEGLDRFEDGNITDGRKAISDRPYLRKETIRKNNHPTVKPTELMQYLIRLVTPNGGTVLDPFNGSGSTGKAVMWENKERNKNYSYVGIELDDSYLEISKARIDYAIKCSLYPEQTASKPKAKCKKLF